MFTTLIASTIISTSVLTWSGDSVDTFQFIMQGPPSTFEVRVWGDVEGQNLLPTFEVTDKDGFVVMAEGGRCAFGWGGCSFGTETIDAGTYTFHGSLKGFAGTTYNTYFWEMRVIDSDCEIGMVAAPIPEPSTYALMLLGLAAVGFAARRKEVAK